MSAKEGYPDSWVHGTVHLNPQSGEFHADGPQGPELLKGLKHRIEQAEARGRKPLAERLQAALLTRHTAHEERWGVTVRDCKHPSCSLDVAALAPEFAAYDAAIDAALKRGGRERS